MTLKERMTKLVSKLKEGLYERDEIISIVLLSALAEQNIFLYGPPGTAKSLISRRLSKAFKTKHYFEHLMQKFSTPEEVFGPISISELKKDNYLRKTEGFLPEAEFAFLDEIWKSSPAILNTLLTIINEKIFKNGSQVNKVPLKVLISASNETPPDNQGLDALYDRFLTRLFVAPVNERANFETILQNGSTQSNVSIDDDLLIKNEEWEAWKSDINKVKLSQETLNIINGIRVEFEKLNKNKPFIYVSDRRWQKAAYLLKASAYFCGRSETNIADCLLLSHCLWTTKDNREKVFKIVEDIIKTNGFDTGISLLKLDRDKEQLEKEINKELFYSKDIYETVKLNNKIYFKCIKNIEFNQGFYDSGKEKITFYIPTNNLKTTDEFHPIDEQGNQLKWIKCNFYGQGICDIKVNIKGRRNSYNLNNHLYWEQIEPFKVTVLYHKGDKKEEVNERLIEAFLKDIKELKATLEVTLKAVNAKKDTFLKELSTPFIEENKLNITVTGINKQIEELQLRIKDCDRLTSLVK